MNELITTEGLHHVDTDATEQRHRRHRAEVLDTTRRHPRTLAEAFPDVRAPAIEKPRPSMWSALWAFFTQRSVFQ